MRCPEILITIPDQQNIYSFEGIDGSGKSTQVSRVQLALAQRGVEAGTAASPSSNLLGTFLRENLHKLEAWQRHSLFVMDMADILIKSANLNPGRIILWDRYIDSNVVSNKDTSPEEAARWVASLPVPRKTFFFDISPEEILKKRVESVHDHSADTEWQQLKYDRYKELAARDSQRIVTIDANQEREIITQIISEVIYSDIQQRK